ncbi:cell division protein FtsW [Acinetobacter qingfengensis]|uniref:Probable peptidoglycan glycosyltransferase FtsW n=2 Tax=Acinetobacter qingfengensis TaxID=1262585 RepID=A0A1E7QWN9_9GAMM|nr:putative lipid II flippase FtsW [Acinetobacter qingfengensis]OEY91522.1 cell division protein FtsW [Acinetobacter qingfengensis]
MQKLPKEITARNTLIFCVLALLCIGTVMVASASMPYAERLHENSMHYVARHLMYLVVAFGAAITAYQIKLKNWFGKMPVLMWLGTAILLILVLLIGRDVNGSTRWLNIAGFTLQPSEIAKFAMAVFTADYVVRRGGEVRESLVSLLRLSIPVGTTVALIMLEPDLGASAVIVCTVALIFFLAGAPVKALLSVIGVVVAFLTTFILIEPYRLRRMLSFSNPWEDPQGAGYQLSQSLMAFGRGEWLGTGLGHSVQKLAYLPEAHTDFMLAVTAEELGFVGISLIFSLSFLMVACCMRIAHRALNNQHLRSGYLAYGIAIIFFLQICVNAGMNMGLIPTKGLTLPFISYGGSSLLICAFMMGVMFRIDRETQAVNTPERIKQGMN